MIEWTEEFSVQIPRIDEHHRRLFSLLNRLVGQFGPEQNERLVIGILTELAEYSSYHFHAEEELFRAKGYPEAPTHIHEHEVFSEKLRALDELVKMNDAAAGKELSEFLSSWFVGHVLTTDRKYVPFLAG